MRLAHSDSAAVDIILSACQPWPLTICPNMAFAKKTKQNSPPPPETGLLISACLWSLKWIGDGGGWHLQHDDIILRYQQSGAAALCQASHPVVATLTSLAFPQLKCRGSVSYQALPYIVLTHPFCKHSNTKMAFIRSCNTSYSFWAGCCTAVDITTATIEKSYTHTFLERPSILLIEPKHRLPSKTDDTKRILKPTWNQLIVLNSGPIVAHGIACYIYINACPYTSTSRSLPLTVDTLLWQTQWQGIKTFVHDEDDARQLHKAAFNFKISDWLEMKALDVRYT